MSDLARIESKVDKVMEKLETVNTRLTELTVRGEALAKLDGRLEVLEKFRLTLVGAVIALSLLSGAVGARYLAPVARMLSAAAGQP